MKQCTYCQQFSPSACSTCKNCNQSFPKRAQTHVANKPAAKPVAKPAAKKSAKKSGDEPAKKVGSPPKVQSAATGGTKRGSAASGAPPRQEQKKKKQSRIKGKLPTIENIPKRLTATSAIDWVLSDALLLHPDLDADVNKNKNMRGDMGEYIFAMIAAAAYNVPWTKVKIVGAHSTRRGHGDGGKDIIITDDNNQRTYIVDMKAWKDGNVSAKDARSIGGALSAIPMEHDNGSGVGIVATNRGFTSSAEDYAAEHNANAPFKYREGSSFLVRLMNGDALKTKMKNAIDSRKGQGWAGNPTSFIEDLLCYLHFRELIIADAYGDEEGQQALAQRAGVRSLGELFKP